LHAIGMVLATPSLVGNGEDLKYFDPICGLHTRFMFGKTTHQLRPIFHSQFLENSHQMVLDCHFAQEDPFCNFSVCFALGHPAQNLAFAYG
jgi:hypothetical protein